MPPFTPFEASILESQSAMADGSIRSVELVDYYLERIDAFDRAGPCINAIRATNSEALAIAAERDAERARGRVRGALHGIPIVVKDNYETFDMATTAGSVLLADFHTRRDSTLVARLRQAGAIVLGKANMHEFAYGITTAGSLFGQTRNPYCLNRHAGGSSGGTAAAVAANFAVVGMGSDTCGSIRIPAAYNNLTGLRATQGLLSRNGIVPLSHTQDIGGPIARSVEDLAIVLDACAGFDSADRQTAESAGQVPESYLQALKDGHLQGKRFGLLCGAFKVADADEEVAEIVHRAARMLESGGAELVPVQMPELESLLDDPAQGYLVLREDFKWDIADYLGRFADAPVKSLADIIASGRCHPAISGRLRVSEATKQREGVAYLKEIARRADLRRALLAELSVNHLDALLYPTVRQGPVLLGEFEQDGTNCRLSAKSGLPSVSLPAGFTGSGAPVGLELLGTAWSEARLLALSSAVERQLNLRQPPESTPELQAGFRT